MNLANGLMVLLLGVFGSMYFAKGADNELLACPDWPTGPSGWPYCSNAAKANSTCVSNSDCSGKQKCCPDGCQMHCTDPVPASNGGRACPPDLPTAAECPPEPDDLCAQDSECPSSNEKCCSEYCDRVCVGSVEVLLVLGEKPVIRGPPEVQSNHMTGGNLRLICSAHGGNQTQISWYKDWVPLKGNLAKERRSGKNIASELTIPESNCSDEVKYQCVAKTASKHALKEFDVRMYHYQQGIRCSDIRYP